jgi:hypothetical protein
MIYELKDRKAGGNVYYVDTRSVTCVTRELAQPGSVNTAIYVTSGPLPKMLLADKEFDDFLAEVKKTA